MILFFYTCVPLIKIICTPDIWCMVPEIWSSTYRIILSSWAFFCPFTPLTAQKIKTSKMKKTPRDIIILHKCTKNHDHPLYCSRDVARDRCNCYFHFGVYFSLLTLSEPKKSKFQSNEKTPWRYHHFTQTYQKLWSYAILLLRYMVRDGCNCYFLFWAIFCPFTPLTARKKKILEKWKNSNNKSNLEILPFYTSVLKIMVICYTFPKIYGVWQM